MIITTSRPSSCINDHPTHHHPPYTYTTSHHHPSTSSPTIHHITPCHPKLCNHLSPGTTYPHSFTPSSAPPSNHPPQSPSHTRSHQPFHTPHATSSPPPSNSSPPSITTPHPQSTIHIINHHQCHRTLKTHHLITTPVYSTTHHAPHHITFIPPPTITIHVITSQTPNHPLASPCINPTHSPPTIQLINN
nr:soluble scavenger receptor cysteine-rich domain-containing protein SSC5D-like [Penaeus vannamei]